MAYAERFLVFEGVDGVGKTAISNRFADFINDAGKKKAELYREPGSTDIGEKLRELIFSKEQKTPETQLGLFLTARLELFFSCIKPQLATGKVVVCDRYVPSTFVYQFVESFKMPIDEAYSLCENLHRMFNLPRPEAYVYLYCNHETYLKRMEKRSSRENNKLDPSDKYIYEKRASIYEAYFDRIRFLVPIVLIDTSTLTKEEVLEQVKEGLQDNVPAIKQYF
jgi:dTMP kinase